MEALAASILMLHLAWIALVIFGTIWTRGHPFWTAAHLACLAWGIVVEVGPWPCPLTLAEQHFDRLAGIQAYRGSFLLHYVDAVVYPHLSYWTIAACGVTVCVINLGVYLWRFVAWARRRTP